MEGGRQAVFAPGAAVVCNLAARKLGEFLAQHSPEEVAGWALDGRDMAAELPESFALPPGIRGRITAVALRGLSRRTPDGRCPAWDTILRMMHDAATTALQTAAAGYAGPQHDAEVLALQNIRTMARLLARDDVRPWYYRQMDALRERLLRAVGPASGASVEAEPGAEEGSSA